MKNVLLVQENGDRTKIKSTIQHSNIAEAVKRVLEAEGRDCSATSSIRKALEQVKNKSCEVLISNLSLESNGWKQLISETRKIRPDLPILVLARDGAMEQAAEAIELGATKLFSSQGSGLAELANKVDDAIRVFEAEKSTLNCLESSANRFMVSDSDSMKELFREAKLVAEANCPVLICGESGTGKELLARRIHQQSQRSSQAFFSINCASIPENLLESEFFGHIAGSFTGASKDREGHFQAANKGSIFLDEIGDMPAALQCKLLRSLQESVVRRIGTNQTEAIDVRVISATNADLKQRKTEGLFRIDLYYRLAVVVLKIPPLRSRPEDIETLAEHFIRIKSASEEPNLSISAQAMSALKSYSWPGNVRQLENVLERASLFSNGEINVSDLSLEEGFDLDGRFNPKSWSLREAASAATKKAEIKIIKEALLETEGNKTEAAKILDVSYKTLLNKIKLHDL